MNLDGVPPTKKTKNIKQTHRYMQVTHMHTHTRMMQKRLAPPRDALFSRSAQVRRPTQVRQQDPTKCKIQAQPAQVRQRHVHNGNQSQALRLTCEGHAGVRAYGNNAHMIWMAVFTAYLSKCWFPRLTDRTSQLNHQLHPQLHHLPHPHLHHLPHLLGDILLDVMIDDVWVMMADGGAGGNKNGGLHRLPKGGLWNHAQVLLVEVLRRTSC